MVFGHDLRKRRERDGGSRSAENGNGLLRVLSEGMGRGRRRLKTVTQGLEDE